MKSLIVTFDIIGLILIIILFSPKGKKETAQSELVNRYDVILVIGQSNTHQGIGFDHWLDRPFKNIKQLGRFNDNDYKIIPAVEPLDHLSKLPNTIGFALTFAKEYERKYLKKGRCILIIPAGMGSTGFSSNYWNPGDTLYQDAVARTNFVLEHFNSRLAAILWHQGESDVGNAAFQERLDSMIVHLRKDITGCSKDVPFILGGLVPYWTDQDRNRIALNRILETTPARVGKTGYADPRMPDLIVKPDNELVAIHFDAKGEREMGRRYFSEYEKLIIVK